MTDHVTAILNLYDDGRITINGLGVIERWCERHHMWFKLETLGPDPLSLQITEYDFRELKERAES